MWWNNGLFLHLSRTMIKKETCRCSHPSMNIHLYSFPWPKSVYKHVFFFNSSLILSPKMSDFVPKTGAISEWNSRLEHLDKVCGEFVSDHCPHVFRHGPNREGWCIMEQKGFVRVMSPKAINIKLIVAWDTCNPLVWSWSWHKKASNKSHSPNNAPTIGDSSKWFLIDTLNINRIFLTLD